MAETRRGDSGVTLIETLVVLVLVAVAAGIVTLSLPGTAPPRAVAQEADLLGKRLNLAAERSLTTGQTLRMAWGDGSYGFSVWDGAAWTPATAQSLAGPHRIESGLILDDPDGARSGEIRITADLMPDAEGPRVLRIGNGALRHAVTFDGARASVAP
ncbi:prepilin-type N-terminal cleavage/methylation domain-containing protein [Sulfitobacter albidus]|uniref:Prepilin-type N-terminal cleavage/methylation domain-containing protein n=1 Tax=Sulfitobacter albidus TaxID=2829501 RepID=A0A975JE53_9RHOB|nr:prepilin-type N-terminal cleavage/methylation domain-containing protein [Sulfitobacter albidus]QUJ76783.1 prepilin-type N-terminal cleavage/methylation domain-containing protein [Sulfitobacter albidus]